MSETVYPARQVAKALGISTGMLRRYAMALEAVSGAPIPQHPRDGRRYSREHLELLTTAKAFVGQHAGMSIETALKIALGHTDGELDTPPPPAPSVNAEALEQAFERALERAVLGELRGLRVANERLLEEVSALRAERRDGLPPVPAAASSEPPSAAHGPIVRAAMWLERLLRRGRL